MKRNFSILLFLICAITASADIHFGDKVCPTDTLAHYQVGPGTWYTRLNVRMSDVRTVKLYMMEVDLTDEHVTLEERNGGGCVGQNEALTTANQLLDSAGHRPIGAINCNFFWTSASSTEGLGGQPTGGTAHDGLLVTEPDSWTMGAQQIDDERWRDMGYMALDYNKRVWMEQMLWDGRVILENGTYNLRDCNRYRTNMMADEIAFFNEGLGFHPTRSINEGIEVVFSVDQWRINSNIHCTVTDINTTGGTLLQKKQGCLQARGNGVTSLQNLQVGDTFSINLGIYAPHIENARPDIKEMAMGNALCMVDSQLICRNWNEAYNTQVYARTGIATNTAGNRFWMLVMETGGMSTEEMCYVFRSAGASYASGCDGGGSAEMLVRGEIMNKTTEGTPRAINTMIFAMSTAPDDNQPARLDFVDNTIRLSAYGSYTPQMRAYNQYGWLLDKNFTDYVLSCEPTTIGSISADGKTFTAGPTAGNGTLIATYGNITCSHPIVVEAGDISLRLDTILIDSRDYRIQTLSSTNGRVLEVDPAHLSWLTDDENVCSINESGILHGLSNGETDVHGSLGDKEVDMHVRVEIADAAILTATDFLNADTSIWILKNSSNPICWGEKDGNSTINFTLSSPRNPQITLTGEMPLYSLPDTIELLLNTPVKIKSLSLFAQPHNATESATATLEEDRDINQDLSYKFAISDFNIDANDIAIYPLKLTKIKFTLTDAKAKEPYSIQLKGLRLIYNHYIVTGFEDIIITDKATEKRMINGHLYLIRNNHCYDLLGRRLK